jgi:predicted DCC family thiol-disulfide oxidoreductase YuxK
MTSETEPVLLYNDECGVCRRIARWVEKSAHGESGETTVVVRPIGDDPFALRSLAPELDIWDAYATIHMLMPDGSMKLGGEAVAEVLRRLPNTRWFAWTLAIRVVGVRPFQMLLNVAYAVLADVRPLFGCESCGTPRLWMRPLVWTIRWVRAMLGGRRHARRATRFAAPLAKNSSPTAAASRLGIVHAVSRSDTGAG